MSAASWAIRFAASLDNVFMVLSGMSCEAQLDDNVAYMKDFRPLDEEEKRIVFRVADMMTGNTAIPCTACAYCVDGCPKHIPIPQYFALYNAEKNFRSYMFSTQKEYYGNLIKTHGRAKDCIGCRKCEHACPQHLKVSELMKMVSKVFD